MHNSLFVVNHLYIGKLQQKIGSGAKNGWVEIAEGPVFAESNALSTQVEDCKVSQVLGMKPGYPLYDMVVS